jgi:DNA-binding transcriptional LysR family regulator
MDISLARTFLEIVATGTFQRAAERLHVTQTAVSARVRTLEDLLGRRLFVRTKSGASLTAAGVQFMRYAPTLVQVWERARHQVAVPPGRRAVLTVGCEVSLWDPLLLDWLVWMRRSAPQLALRTEVGVPEALLKQVGAGVVAGLGPLGREYLLAAGGAGYFRLSVVRSHIKSGRLRRVPHAPEFLYPAYAV